jgi:L-ascorbate metabolism protein UlaG (beta-lactamase superfamily)
MEITWYGLSCFRLAERGFANVITDPYDHRETGLQPLKLNADIVTISHDAPGHNHLDAVNGSPYVVHGPGEYEVGGVFITGIQTGGQRGSEYERNTLYVFDFDALTVAHLGNLSRVLTQAEVEEMGTINIAIVPVGSGGSLNASKAAEVIGMLEPNIVIPMHYAGTEGKIPLDSLVKFLKEMGISEARTQASFKVAKNTLPEEMQVIVLDEQQG